MMYGKWPGEIASYDADARTAQVKIDRLTDGADGLLEAEFEYPLGDKSWHTEVRILPGDLVWLEFMGGDPRFPIVTGYRAKGVGNANGWRKFHHANIEHEADAEIVLKAGTKITFVVGGAKVELTADQLLATVAQTTMTGSTTSQGAFEFQSGMTGKGGAGGGAAMTIDGGAEFSEDVIANGVSTSGHTHLEHGPGSETDPPTK